MDALLDGPPPANPALTLEVPSASTNEIIPVDLTEVFQPNNDQEFDQQLQDITNLLRDEKADVKFWVTLVQQCWAHGKSRVALETAELGLQGSSPLSPFSLTSNNEEREKTRNESDTDPSFFSTALSSSYSSSPSHYPTPLHLLRATYHIALSRRAPKTRLDKPRTGPIGLTKDKEHPEFPRYGVLDGVGPQGKEHYLKEADRDIDLVERNDGDSKVARDVRGASAVSLRSRNRRAVHRLDEGVNGRIIGTDLLPPFRSFLAHGSRSSRRSLEALRAHTFGRADAVDGSDGSCKSAFLAFISLPSRPRSSSSISTRRSVDLLGEGSD